ncbi:alpha/beta hydrolase [Alcaligenaceae bacterium]|nr:alpha/beta hydrolase [Alcaligenaceae bacterium]
MTDLLHPQVQAVLNLLKEAGIPQLESMDPPQARIAYLERGPNVQPAAPEVGGIRNLEIEGKAGKLPLRIYRPENVADDATLPALVWFHGGGWVIGNLDTHDTLCRELCNASGCCIVSVDYRLAPEHRFPAAVEDAVTSVEWVFENAAQINIDPRRIAVGGDSAGGNLAAVAAIALRDSDDIRLAYQLLVYPVIDLGCDYPSHTRNGQGYVLTNELLAYFYGHYMEDESALEDWRACPIRAESLENLPPALVITAGYDPLRDEGAAYAVALAEAGNETTYVCFERQIHGFITMGKVFSDAYPAISLCAGELRRRLSGAQKA